MKEKAQKWAHNMRYSGLQRQDVWLALQTTIRQTLEYPLPASTLSANQCADIMKPVLNVALPLCGIQSSFPRDLAHSPSKYQGLGIPSLYVQQGISHLAKMIQFGRDPTSFVGQLMRTSMELLKLETGIGNSILSRNYHIFGILACKSWLKHTWEFAARNNIKVIDTCPEIPLLRLKDRYLMELFVTNGNYWGNTLQQLNKCRLYLRVATLADILDGSGRIIRSDMWAGKACLYCFIIIHREQPKRS